LGGWWSKSVLIKLGLASLGRKSRSYERSRNEAYDKEFRFLLFLGIKYNQIGAKESFNDQARMFQSVLFIGLC
jgi:transposase